MIRMIIDGHTHMCCYKKKVKPGASRELLRSMDAAGIGKALVIGIYPQTSNELLAEACRAHPQKLCGFASVNPLGGRKSAEELEKCIDVLGLKGVKLHPRLQGFDLGDPRIGMLVSKASDLRIPVMVDFFVTRSDPKPFDAVGKLAERFPDVNFILAHMGGIMIWDAFFLAKELRNVYLDMSFSPSYFQGSSISEDLNFVIKKLRGEKIIYGSDHPEVNAVDSLKMAKKMFTSLKLPRSYQEKIFSKNIKSVVTGI